MPQFLSTPPTQGLLPTRGSRVGRSLFWIICILLCLWPAGAAQAAPTLQSPQPRFDSATLGDDNTVLVDVLANDTISSNQPLEILSVVEIDLIGNEVSGPGIAELEIVDNKVRYTFTGQRTREAQFGGFSYVVNAVGAPSFRARTGFVTIDIPPGKADAITISANTIAEDARFGSVVGTLDAPGAVQPFFPSRFFPRFFISTASADRQINNSTIFNTFRIDGNQLRTRVALDAETQSSYTIRIAVLDGAFNTFKQDITITVEDVNDPPTAINLSNSRINENQPAGATVGRLSSVDADSNSHTYALTSLTISGSEDRFDNDLFQIDGNTLKTAVLLDFEERPSYEVNIESTDDGGASFDKVFRITLNNLPSPPDTPINNLSYCTGDDITLFERTSSPRVSVKIDDIAISDKGPDNCQVDGKMTIVTNGNTIRDLDFSGQVNKRNQFTPSQTDIPNFDISLAGLTMQAREVEIEYINDKPSLHITQPRLKLPRALSGADALVTIPTRIGRSGLDLGTGEIALPEIVTKSGIGLELRGAFRARGDGFEIDAGGTLGIPSIKPTKKSNGQECAISADVTIFADAQNNTVLVIAAGTESEGAGSAVQTISTGPDAFASPDATDDVSLRRIAASLSCSPGLPIANTGLFLTGLGGEITLTPGEERVQVDVTIEAGKSVGGFPVVSLDGSMGVGLRPSKFELDMEAALNVLFIKVAETDTVINKNGFKARLEFSNVIFAVVPIPYSVEAEIAVFKKSNRGTFTGSGEINVGLKKEQIVEAGCVLGVCLFPPPIPPVDLFIAGLDVEAGEFTNRNFGFKGTINLPLIPSGSFFVDSGGTFTFRNTNRFRLIDDPFVRAALVRRQQVQNGEIEVQAAALDGITFVDTGADSPQSVIINTPLIRSDSTLNQVQAAGVTDVITEVNLIQHGDVLFTLAANEPLSLTLITPEGQEVTPANYDQSEVLGHVIDYAQASTYVDLSEKAESAANETPNGFFGGGTVEPNFPTILFTAATTDPALTGVDLKVNGSVVYFDIDAQDSGWLKPLPLAPGQHTVELVSHATDNVVQSATINLITGTHYSLMNVGGPAAELVLLADDRAAPETMGKAKVRLFNGATDSLDMVINGNPIASAVAYKAASDYVLVDPGEVTLELLNSSDSTPAAESLTTTLLDGRVYTFVSSDEPADSTSGFDANITQRVDIEYAAVHQTFYQVDQAEMGALWQVKLLGDTDNISYTITVDGLPGPPVLGSVAVDATNPAATNVSWQLTADLSPTTIQIVANPGDIMTTVTVTNTDGTTGTKEIPLYVGEPIAEFEITGAAELGGQFVTKQIDLSHLETGIYHLWVRADDGINPPTSSYAAAPSVMAAGIQSIYGTNAVRHAQESYDRKVETENAFPIVLDNSTSFPTEWTAVISTTFNSGVNTLDLEWMLNSHPDVDTYVLHYGNAPLSVTNSITVGVAAPEVNEDGTLATDVFGATTVLNIKPDTPYYFSIEGIDSETEQSVRSQEVEFMVASPVFALTTAVTDVSVKAGETISVPVTLDADDGLFFKNVWLSADLSGAPLGVSGGFAPNAEEFFELNTVNTQRMMQFTIDASVPAGTYPISITGYNGEKKENLQFNLMVTADGEQPDTSSGSIFLPFVSQ